MDMDSQIRAALFNFFVVKKCPFFIFQMMPSVSEITPEHLGESRHTSNWKEVEILAKEKNIIKRKFKESVAILQEKKDNLLNKKEDRKVISDTWSAIIT